MSMWFANVYVLKDSTKHKHHRKLDIDLAVVLKFKVLPSAVTN